MLYLLKFYFKSNMKATFILLITCIFSSLFSAQILDEFPKKQEFYNGGLTELYKDIHNISINKKLSACKTKEIYQAKLLLTKEAKIKFITDFDSININKNKCAYDYTLNVLKELKNSNKWIAAKVNDKNFDAIIRLFFVPNHIIENYEERYTPYKFYIPVTYAGGVDKMNKDIHDQFMSIFSDYHVNGKLFLDFVVDENGEIVNPIITPKIDNEMFNKDIVRSIRRTEGKWNPALLDGIPVKSRMSIPLNFSINFWEK